jgi:hypothetical protein
MPATCDKSAGVISNLCSQPSNLISPRSSPWRRAKRIHRRLGGGLGYVIRHVNSAKIAVGKETLSRSEIDMVGIAVVRFRPLQRLHCSIRNGAR